MDPLDPELRLEMKALKSLGYLELSVEITPDNISQEHRFRFEIDQSYLPPLVAEIMKLLEKFPYRER